MTVIFILLPLTTLMAAVAVMAFIWAAQDGQLDDLDTPAVRMLHDDASAQANRSALGPAVPKAIQTGRPK